MLEILPRWVDPGRYCTGGSVPGPPGVRLYGPADPRKLEERVPTFAITVEGLPPRTVAEKLDEHNIYVWDGNYYALEVTNRLGLEDTGGMVRIGPVHYNTLEEIERFGEALKSLV